VAFCAAAGGRPRHGRGLVCRIRARWPACGNAGTGRGLVRRRSGDRRRLDRSVRVGLSSHATSFTSGTMKIAFTTLGCKVNQYDPAPLETAVLAQGDTVVPFAAGADVYVVNTCTVTDRADAESRQLARRARRLNPHARVIMTGCFAQTSPERAAAL